MNEQEVTESIKYAISKVNPEHLKKYFLNAYNPEDIEKPKRRLVRRQPKKNYKPTL